MNYTLADLDDLIKDDVITRKQAKDYVYLYRSGLFCAKTTLRLYICTAYDSDYMFKKVKGQEEEERFRDIIKQKKNRVIPTNTMLDEVYSNIVMIYRCIEKGTKKDVDEAIKYFESSGLYLDYYTRDEIYEEEYYKDSFFEINNKPRVKDISQYETCSIYQCQYFYENEFYFHCLISYLFNDTAQELESVTADMFHECGKHLTQNERNIIMEILNRRHEIKLAAILLDTRPQETVYSEFDL